MPRKRLSARASATHTNQQRCGPGRTAWHQFYGPSPGFRYDDRVPILGVSMPSLVEQLMEYAIAERERQRNRSWVRDENPRQGGF